MVSSESGIDGKIETFLECLSNLIDGNIDLHENNYHDREVDVNFYKVELEFKAAIKELLECKNCSCTVSSKANSGHVLKRLWYALKGV